MRFFLRHRSNGRNSLGDACSFVLQLPHIYDYYTDFTMYYEMRFNAKRRRRKKCVRFFFGFREIYFRAARLAAHKHIYTIGHRFLSGGSVADMLLSNFVIPLCKWSGDCYVPATFPCVCVRKWKWYVRCAFDVMKF